jgi:hypothetical protein
MPVKPKPEEYGGAVLRAAAAISKAVDKMAAELPVGTAPQVAIELLISALVPLQPQAMQMVMEHPGVLEAYQAAVAELPVTAGPRG